MFSFFSKKSAIAPENVPLPESPPRLRTPSPSIASGSANGAHPSPAPTASTSSNRVASPARQAEIHQEVVPRPDPTPESLTALIVSVPAKTLHAYTLSHISEASQDTIKTLTSFFDALTPPPKIHCVRCHKDYVEVENEERSCLVPHDDESAEVERVGRGSEAKRTTGATEYETLWGCCGKIAEGNGDQGPPDGFCYEGKHTTDIKRARFRADSTLQDDKLVSCLRRNCHGIRDAMPRSSARKRPRSRVNYEEAASEDEGSEGEADSGMEQMVKKGSTKPKPKSRAQPKGKGREKEAEEDQMDVDEGDVGEVDSASRAGSVRGKAKAKPVVPSTPSSAPKRRGRPPKSKAAAKDSDAESVAASVKSVTVPSAKRGRGRRVPKSKMYVSDSEDERGRSAGPRGAGSKPPSASASPSRAPKNDLPPRTRSQSRSRVQSMVSRLEATATKTPSKSKNVDQENEDDDNEAQPKKKRKVAS